MSTDHDDSVFPVASWTIGPLPSYNCVLFKPNYLSSPMQPVEEAHQGHRFVLTPEQAVELANSLLRSVQTLETLSAQGAPDHERLQ
ncbi:MULTISPECIES: hypothetical protein [Aeromonas]|uniref:hypothetical protein n=1 Tax=Aeromonas TaxID=642 RepID=UPI0005B478EC|nr:MULTISPECIES: hypothetical protein [Aeromonas]AUZ78719.1 bssS family protein [Aeromonas sp. ASNIH1]EIS3740055.1 hypothetical protein [Aeromonas hydrophila]EIS3742234.1 hypothetical protein [Aeromonas hydrophila]MCP3286944.1 hypothetical protein [Aeromonas hydrophila]MDH1846951.1 hypothetical protein [Aeromonas caviae]